MRKNSLLKKTAWIVLSAVLFGTVAGTVMTGVQIASSGMVSQFFAIVSSENMTHGKQLSYIKAEMHQKNCSAVTNLILEIKACEYIVMKHCH